MMQIAFYKSKKHLFNRLVSWWTGGPYSHVEAVLAENEDGTFVCASASHRDGGVRIKTMPLPEDTWDIATVSADSRAVLDWFHQHKGMPYDTLGLFGFVWHRGVQDPKRWFCSEAVAASLGYDEPWRYDPNTLFDVLRNQNHG